MVGVRVVLTVSVSSESRRSCWSVFRLASDAVSESHRAEPASSPGSNCGSASPY